MGPEEFPLVAPAKSERASPTSQPLPRFRDRRDAGRKLARVLVLERGPKRSHAWRVRERLRAPSGTASGSRASRAP